MRYEDWTFLDRILLNALKEDIGNGDITTSSLISPGHVSEAAIVAKGKFIIAGLFFARRIFQLIDRSVRFRILKEDGTLVEKGEIIAKVRGESKSVLSAERTALNFLQRLSGIATYTAKYVKALEGYKVKIVDTRKTAPGLRYFDKYAVRIGGGYNHRFGLSDGILIKDNHIAAVGGIAKAVKLVRERAHHLLKVEIEVKSISEVREALSAGVDVIMLDNMSIDKMRKAVNIIRSKSSRVIIEASGNITLENIREIAETGVDIISIGALTHSAPAADITLRVD
jgi:nicotinate-nucleotide pyrophosphorylase (carboxylating)